MPPSARLIHFRCDAIGWPYRALAADACMFYFRRNGGKLQAGPWQPTSGVRLLGTAIVLPTRPLWRGLLVDTAFHAIVAYVLLFVPGDVRRWLRRRRGLCVKCAYPVSGGTCSECGTLDTIPE